MTQCNFTPITDTRVFKRDAVLGLMRAKDWIPEMKSCVELDFCIKIAERDLAHGEEIDTIEDFVGHINWIFFCEWDCNIKEWFQINEEEE